MREKREEGGIGINSALAVKMREGKPGKKPWKNIHAVAADNVKLAK